MVKKQSSPLLNREWIGEQDLYVEGISIVEQIAYCIGRKAG
jgi:hypothetical protein